MELLNGLHRALTFNPVNSFGMNLNKGSMTGVLDKHQYPMPLMLMLSRSCGWMSTNPQAIFQNLVGRLHRRVIVTTTTMVNKSVIGCLTSTYFLAGIGQTSAVHTFGHIVYSLLVTLTFGAFIKHLFSKVRQMRNGCDSNPAL